MRPPHKTFLAAAVLLMCSAAMTHAGVESRRLIRNGADCRLRGSDTATLGAPTPRAVGLRTGCQTYRVASC